MNATVIASSDAPGRVNLLGMTQLQLEQFFLDLGEKKFRAQQVMKWIHHAGVIDIEAMSNLGKALRDPTYDINREALRPASFVKIVGSPVDLAAHTQYRVRLEPGFLFCGQGQLVAGRGTDCARASARETQRQ